MSEAQAPRLTIEAAHCRPVEDKLEVEISLVNGEDRLLFVTSGVRQIRYDAASRTLDLWLSDHGRTAGMGPHRCQTISVPRTETIEPGARHTLHLEISQRLTRLVPDDDGFHFEDVDLSAAEQFTLHLGCSEKPFYYNPKGPDPLKQLNAWCQPLEVSGRLAERPAPKGKRAAPSKKK